MKTVFRAGQFFVNVYRKSHIEYGFIYVDGDYMENRYEDVYIAYTCKKKKNKRLITYWKVVNE